VYPVFLIKLGIVTKSGSQMYAYYESFTLPFTCTQQEDKNWVGTKFKTKTGLTLINIIIIYVYIHVQERDVSHG
jgi:hypothetical protein